MARRRRLFSPTFLLCWQQPRRGAADSAAWPRFLSTANSDRMNRRYFLSLFGLAPVGAVAFAFDAEARIGGFARRRCERGDKEECARLCDQGRTKYCDKASEVWPRTGETRQVFLTHNVGQPDWYQTEHQIVFDGTEWVDNWKQ